MNKENLLKLADVLDRVPPEKFNMDDYGRMREPLGAKARCATACCALGWATAIPELNLELRANRGDRTAWVFDTTTGRIYDGEGGVFDLTYRQASQLFRSGFGMTASEKAAEIRQMVEAGR